MTRFGLDFLQVALESTLHSCESVGDMEFRTSVASMECNEDFERDFILILIYTEVFVKDTVKS